MSVDRAGDQLPSDGASTSVVVEVHADGGIRVTKPDGRAGLASLRVTREWIAEANRTNAAVRLRGDLAAPLAVPVATEVRRLAATLDERPSAPSAWPKRYSSLQTAAAHGLTEPATDLLERGVSPDGGRWGRSPYRLAMQRGHVETLAVLRAAGARQPRLLAPPAALPEAIVVRAYTPRRMWWLLVPFVVLAAVAIADGAYGLAPALLAFPLLGIAAAHLMLVNTTCAFDGPLVARRRGRHWQGPIDLRELDALGYTVGATIRAPTLWVLGQRGDGDKPDVWSKSAFASEQRSAIADLRFVPLYASGGFLSPGFERLLDRHVDRTRVLVGHLAAQRVWPL